MFSIKPFYPSDVFRLNKVNLDIKTENYTFDYYLHYFLNHNEDCLIIDTPYDQKNVVAYIIAKHEINSGDLAAHISGISVAPGFRKSGFARNLLEGLKFNAKLRKAKFVDLFVRISNSAVEFYKKLGYVTNKMMMNYYSDPQEHAFDMRLYLN